MQTVGELAAGYELDALVAEKVMRNRPVGLNYSTDIAAAWQVADIFDEVDLHKGPHGWLCRLERGADDAAQHGEALRAETAPLAICRAALAAVAH